MNAVVEVDGEPVFDAFLTDDGIPPLGGITVWRYLDDARFVPVDEDSKRWAEPHDVTLKGNVVVRVDHVGRLGHRVEVDELTLLHGHREEADGFYLPVEWIRAHEPPGDLAKETRTIAWRRGIEFWRIPTGLATFAAVAIGCLLAIVALVSSLLGGRPGWIVSVAALLLTAGSLVCSGAAWCLGSELFAGSVWPVPVTAAVGLLLSVVVCRCQTDGSPFRSVSNADSSEGLRPK